MENRYLRLYFKKKLSKIAWEKRGHVNISAFYQQIKNKIKTYLPKCTTCLETDFRSVTYHYYGRRNLC